MYNVNLRYYSKLAVANSVKLHNRCSHCCSRFSSLQLRTIVSISPSVPSMPHCYQAFCLTNGLGCFVVIRRSVWPVDPPLVRSVECCMLHAACCRVSCGNGSCISSSVTEPKVSAYQENRSWKAGRQHFDCRRLS